MDFINGLIANTTDLIRTENNLFQDKTFLRLHTPRRARYRFIILNKNGELDVVGRFEHILLRIRRWCGKNIPIFGEFIEYNGRLTARALYKHLYMQSDPALPDEHPQLINRRFVNAIRPWLLAVNNKVSTLYQSLTYKTHPQVDINKSFVDNSKLALEEKTTPLPTRLSKAYDLRLAINAKISFHHQTLVRSRDDNMVNEVIRKYPQYDVSKDGYIEDEAQEERIGNLFDQYVTVKETVDKLCTSFYNYSFYYSKMNTKQNCWGKSPRLGMRHLEHILDRLRLPPENNSKLLRKQYFQLRTLVNTQLTRAINEVNAHIQSVRVALEELDNKLNAEKIEKEKIFFLKHNGELVQRIMKIVNNEIQKGSLLIV